MKVKIFDESNKEIFRGEGTYWENGLENGKPHFIVTSTQKGKGDFIIDFYCESISEVEDVIDSFQEEILDKFKKVKKE